MHDLKDTEAHTHPFPFPEQIYQTAFSPSLQVVEIHMAQASAVGPRPQVVDLDGIPLPILDQELLRVHGASEWLDLADKLILQFQLSTEEMRALIMHKIGVPQILEALSNLPLALEWAVLRTELAGICQ